MSRVVCVAYRQKAQRISDIMPMNVRLPVPATSLPLITSLGLGL
jgi:hypothetical protein